MTTDPPTADARRALRFLPWIALAGYAFCCLALWARELWYPEWDSAIYLLTAQSIAGGDGYTYLDQPFFLRPPGFSWFLSFFAKQGGFDYGAVNLAIMGLAAASVGAIYFAVRVHGRPWLALAAALLTGTSALFVSNFNWIQSEYLFTVLLFAAIGALHLARGKSSRWLLWALLGSLALVGSIYARTFGVLLLPALVMVALTRPAAGPRWRILVPISLTLLCVLPWVLHSGAAAGEAEPPSEQLLLFDYGTALFHEDPGDPGSPRIDFAGWMDRIASNGEHFARDLARTTLGTNAGWAALLVSLLLIYGIVLAAINGPALIAWFTAFSLLLLLTYFTYAERLLLPLIPCTYVLGGIVLERGLRVLGARMGLAQWAPRVSLAIGVALFVFNAATLSGHMDPAPEGTPRAAKWRDIEATAAWLRENTPPEAVLLCNQAPILSLMSGRRAFTYRFLRSPNPLTKYDVDYVVFDGIYPLLLKELVSPRVEDVWMLPSESLAVPIGIAKLRPSGQ